VGHGGAVRVEGPIGTGVPWVGRGLVETGRGDGLGAGGEGEAEAPLPYSSASAMASSAIRSPS
jgi:hypothetical protein